MIRNYKSLPSFGVITLLFCLSLETKAQKLSQEKTSNSDQLIFIKTNLLCDITTTLNLGLEFKVGDNASLDISGNLNPFEFENNIKWKHILVQPEFRWWTKDVFVGHFFGLHAHWAYYNIGRLPQAIFSDYTYNNRFEGWLAGAGLNYGYRWNFNKSRWALETEIGVGYAYLDYEQFDCKTCGKKLAEETKNYVGTTKAAVNLIYNLDKKPKDNYKATSQTAIKRQNYKSKSKRSYEKLDSILLKS